MKNIILSTISLGLIHTGVSYTAKQANQCFVTQALPKCSIYIQKCNESPSCQNQLLRHQDCTFGQQQQQIFNGYCFKKWQKQAQQTSQIINCMIDQCDLLYNSQIGLKQLYQCSQKVIVQLIEDQELDCQEQCLRQLNKVQTQFYKKSHKDLFKIKLNDKQSELILQKIRAKCINDNDQNSSQNSQGEQVQYKDNNDL